MKKITLMITQNMEASAKVNGKIQEIISGIEEIKISNKEYTESRKINSLNESITNLSIRQAIWTSFISEVVSLLSNLISILVLGVFALGITKNEMSMGDYMAFSGYMPKLLLPIQLLALSLTSLQPAIKAVKRVCEYFEKEETEENLPEMVLEKGEIQFKNVSFRYGDSQKYVLKNLNFSIPAGSKVIIKGENGSGKTTILKLILGLYLNYTGDIFIDKKNVKMYKQSSIRDQISFVSQNIFLFSGTVKENILYSVSEYTDQDIEAALKISGLLDLVNNGTLSLDSNVGENGILLSGGQRQMIAIARAVIKKSKIWIFDEPTSNLDSCKTMNIYKKINETSDEKTCLIVSHDVINEINIDKIISLEQEEKDE